MKEIKDFIKDIPGLSKNVQQIKQDIRMNERLAGYCKKHAIVLNEEKLDNSSSDLLNFIEHVAKCENCQGLQSCTQTNIGFKPILKDEQAFISLKYVACAYQQAFETQTALASNLKSFYMPKKILNATMDSIELTKDRQKAINRCATFAKAYQKDHYIKGLYLTGPFGVGKTYLLAAMANALAKRNIPVAFVYFPDLVRELKSAIGKNNLENYLTEVKSVQVLIIDDIGSEMNTQWMRDEILGPLLQYRMLEELPTFFSSNKTMGELIRDYATTNDNVKDEAKAQRIGDRIRTLAEEIEVNGKNYRY